MNRFACVFVSILAMAATAVSAQKETELGSRILRPSPAEPDYRSKLSENDQARLMVDDFAVCTQQYSKKAVDKALELIPGESGSSAALNKLAQPRCLRDATLRMPPELLRGALFRAKVIDEFGDKPLRLSAVPADPTRLASDLEVRKQLQHVLLQDFASCVVREKPSAAAAFVIEYAGSAEEQEALDKLIPALGPCLLDGQEVKFSRDALSAQLAEALYHELVEGTRTDQIAEAAE